MSDTCEVLRELGPSMAVLLRFPIARSTATPVYKIVMVLPLVIVGNIVGVDGSIRQLNTMLLAVFIISFASDSSDESKKNSTNTT